MKTHRVIFALLTIATASVTLAGCNENRRPDPSPSPRPIRPPQTRSPIPMSFFDQMVERASQYIATELPKDGTVAKSTTKLVLAVSPGSVSSNANADRMLNSLQSLQGTLMGSDAIRNNFLVLTVKHTESKQVLDELGAARPYQTQDALSGVQKDVRYVPEDIYLLTASGIEAVDRGGDEHSFRMRIQVVHPRSGRIVLNKEFAQTVAFDGQGNRWEAAAERK